MCHRPPQCHQHKLRPLVFASPCWSPIPGEDLLLRLLQQWRENVLDETPRLLGGEHLVNTVVSVSTIRAVEYPQ